MPSNRPDLETIYVQIPREMKRSLEELVIEYKRRRQGGPRTLSGAVRLAIDTQLQRELPGYVALVNKAGEPPELVEGPRGG